MQNEPCTIHSVPEIGTATAPTAAMPLLVLTVFLRQARNASGTTPLVLGQGHTLTLMPLLLPHYYILTHTHTINIDCMMLQNLLMHGWQYLPKLLCIKNHYLSIHVVYVISSSQPAWCACHCAHALHVHTSCSLVCHIALHVTMHVLLLHAELKA